MLSASENVGLSSSSRLHDLYINFHAMSPAQFRNKGQGLEIDYGYHQTPFGTVIIGQTDKGICSLFFSEVTGQEECKAELTGYWLNAQLNYRPRLTKQTIETVFSLENDKQINLLVGGTNFQVKVWQALLDIPFGEVRNYGQIAQAIDSPKASRAVGSAIGNNPIAMLIPCHRVIKSTGVIGDYHWGSERKKAILTWEQCQLSA